jgi:hypothetical protein
MTAAGGVGRRKEWGADRYLRRAGVKEHPGQDEYSLEDSE